MAAVDTLSPSSGGRCLPHPNDIVTTGAVSNLPYKEEHIDNNGLCETKSAPEGVESDQLCSYSGRQRGRRRKRRNSTHENQGGVNALISNGKRRRGNANHHKRQQKLGGRFILPNKFLLGGNITDPLNLNSMQDENINRALNAVTPSSSPLPPRNSTIDIVLPTDVTDPLGLNCSSTFKNPILTTPETKGRGKRKRRRKSQAPKQDMCLNSDTTSNSDDQKLLKEETSTENKGDVISPVSVGATNGKGNIASAKKPRSSPSLKKPRSSPINVNRTTLSSSANIKDPVVSPALPQDMRRHRSSFNYKPRRRKHGGGKPSTTDAEIQTDSSLLVDYMTEHRCRSEKNLKRNVILPVKRRRTVSENLQLSDYWNEERKEVTIRSFQKENSAKKAEKTCSDIINEKLHANYDESEKPTEKSKKNTQINEQEEGQKRSEKKTNTAEESNHRPTDKQRERNGYDRDESRDSSSKSQKPFRFPYGNYSMYYGYRNPEKFKDVRMEVLKKEWFKDKDVLDIGCNSGQLTLLIARDYEPRKIVGIDIDDSLIRIARKNIRHYASTEKIASTKFPMSMAITFGPIVGPPIETGKDETTAAFPNNVNFFQGNYVPKKDEFLRFQEPEYDVIMCMSVTKWIHLNWGDEGLIRMFHRVFRQLRAGGMFILEPQRWDSYKHKKRMADNFMQKYRSIELLPESFPNFLLRDVGFKKVNHLAVPNKNKPKGFQRPVQIYYKPE